VGTKSSLVKSVTFFFFVITATSLILTCLSQGNDSLSNSSDNLLNSSPGVRANPLEIDKITLSARTGGVINFTLDAGPQYKYRLYIIFAGQSGTAPGHTLPSGLNLPINWDSLSTYVFSHMNTPDFLNFVGPLNLIGQGSAQMTTTGQSPISAGCIGKKLHFAFVTSCYWDFVSNTVEVEIVP